MLWFFFFFDTFWRDWEKCYVFFLCVFVYWFVLTWYCVWRLVPYFIYVMWCDCLIHVCRRQCLVKQCSPQAIYNALQSCNQQYALSMPICICINIYICIQTQYLLGSYILVHTMRSMLIISAQEAHRCTATQSCDGERREHMNNTDTRKEKEWEKQTSTHIYPPSWLFHWL